MKNNIRRFFDLHPEGVNVYVHTGGGISSVACPIRVLHITQEVMVEFVNDWVRRVEDPNDVHTNGKGMCNGLSEYITSNGESFDISYQDFLTSKTAYDFMGDLIYFAKFGVQFNRETATEAARTEHSYPFGTEREYKRECYDGTVLMNRQRRHFINSLLEA